MEIIAVYHNKGGVGKTTTVVNLAAGFALEGKRVLVVDLDAQANATLALGVAGRSEQEDADIRDRHVAHLLRSKLLSVSDVVRPSRFGDPPVDVVPSHIAFHDPEYEKLLAGASSAQATLYNKLKAQQDRWDIVLIDAPPARDVFAQIALLACDHLLIPSDLKPFAFSGLGTVKALVAEVDGIRKKQVGREPIRVLGVVPSKILSNASFLRHSLPSRIRRVQDVYGLPVLETMIFERTEVARSFEQESVVGGQFVVSEPRSIFAYAPNGESARDFRNLVHEVLRRLERRT